MAIPHAKHEFFKARSAAVANIILCSLIAALICGSLTQVRPFLTTRLYVCVVSRWRTGGASRKDAPTFQGTSQPHVGERQQAEAEGERRSVFVDAVWFPNRLVWSISVWKWNKDKLNSRSLYKCTENSQKTPQG